MENWNTYSQTHYPKNYHHRPVLTKKFNSRVKGLGPKLECRNDSLPEIGCCLFLPLVSINKKHSSCGPRKRAGF